MSYQHSAHQGLAQTKKWACAHWCASPNAGTTQQFPILEYTLVTRKRQTTETGIGQANPVLLEPQNSPSQML